MNVHYDVKKTTTFRQNFSFEKKIVSIFFRLGNPKCFSGDDHVSMANGETKLLRDVRPGDRALVMNDEKRIVEDVVMMMLDSQPNLPGQFRYFR